MTALNPEVRQIDPTAPLAKEQDPRGLGGLIAWVEGKEQPLPLTLVRVRADIAGDCCRTVVEQHFSNPWDKVLEATHIFPLPEDGAIVEVELEADGVVVRAECRQREEAEKIFEDAREAGYQAGLLTQERADVHTLRVTNLPPNSNVFVRIVVVERLEMMDGRWRWRFPTVIAPRYLPGTPIGHQGPGVLPDSDHVPDASRLQPPLRLEGGTTLDLEVMIHGRVRRLESSLHAVRMDLGDNGEDGIRVAPSGNATLDRDFILSFSSSDEKETTLRGYTDGEHTLVTIEPPSVEFLEALPRDAAFVIDRSGSMRGPKMGAAKLALKSALHGLQPGDRFMLIAFSQEMQSYATGFTDYTQEALEDADDWIDKIQAGGGTEMLPAIKASLSEKRLEGRSYTVLLITDGQVWNEAELVAAVAHRREEARFFTMGIGTAVSAALLKRLARVGGGTCELLTPTEDIEEAVARLESRLGSPIAEDVLLEGGKSANESPKTLFIGRPAAWLLEGAPRQVKVVGKTVSGTFQFEAKPLKIEFPLGALWAREKVSALEDRITLSPDQEEAIRMEIIQIALQHHIASRFTAFVAVEKSKTVTGERIEIVQPVELPKDWDPSFLGIPAADQLRGMALKSSVQYAMAPPPTGIALDHSLDHIPNDRYSRLRSKSRQKDTSRGSSKPEQESLGGKLARMQNADGSFGEDVNRTVAALMALVILGHTMRKGIRRRTVLKAVTWLETRPENEFASLALEVLSHVEAGGDLRDILAQRGEWLETLISSGEEGRLLKQAIREPGKSSE